MPFKIKVVEVNIEEVRNGRNKYDKASVVYSFNGQNRTQTIMSFSNPAIFSKVRSMKVGEEYNVEVTKNDKGYNQWASIELAGAPPSTGSGNSVGSPGSRTSVSTYETPEERKIKQMYIIKQSSISAAIARAGQLENPAGVDILSLAQSYVDFVYGNHDEKDLFSQDNDFGNDDLP